MKRVVVINPNSTERISAQIAAALQTTQDIEFEVVTSQHGPAAIETDKDVVDSIGPMLSSAEAHPADAYVVACFSDPGLTQLRDQSDAPSFGIAESAMLAATRIAERVGVISSVSDSIPRHERYWKRLGLDGFVAGDEAVGLGALALHTDDAYERVLVAGRRLVDQGATALVLGCTGMTHMQKPLAHDLGATVIDPCRAAAQAAAASLSATMTS